ncbi:MAG: LexA family transcriptional regulator [Lamprobacter sp.]|uniref:LexA family protein n=1 Tax=Lamprobacter sp. TaxID=3100796 RepID=UPI002B2573CC|nr:LexA family transcriptional regulator [Lamprobacter sp.]MEA3641901.1 LexA family transcriptional regulator [Lamprobacter sp.]
MTEPRLLIQHRHATQLVEAPELIDTRTEPMTTLPLMGRVSAGQPLEAIEDPDWVEVPERLARIAAFALRVQGDSMIEDQIEDGDLILVKPQASAANGEVVIALIDGEQATLKRFYRELNHIRLQPAHAEMLPLRFPADAVQVVGIVTGVMRWNPSV